MDKIDQEIWKGIKPPDYSKAYDKAISLCQISRHTNTLFIPIVNKKTVDTLKAIGLRERLNKSQRPEYGMFCYIEKVLSVRPEFLDIAIDMEKQEKLREQTRNIGGI